MSQAEFDRFAREYRALHAKNIEITGEGPEYFARYKMADFARRLHAIGAPLDGRYLDFGSGVGASIAPFLECLPQGRLVCADVSQDSLAESARLHGEVATYVPIESGALPVESGSLDGAFACCVFHHIPAQEHPAALLEIRRVLKADSPLMVYEHNPLNPLTVRAVRTCPLDENAVLIRAGEMRRRCERAGFRNVRIEYRVFFPSFLSALRGLENRLRWLPLGAQYAVHARA
jgi:SAM-dependent methyltransferase